MYFYLFNKVVHKLFCIQDELFKLENLMKCSSFVQFEKDLYETNLKVQHYQQTYLKTTCYNSFECPKCACVPTKMLI